MLWTLVFSQFQVPCSNPRIRKDFRAYSTAEWEDYSDAVRKLQSSGDLSKFVDLHWKMYDNIHSPQSGPKHRNFMTWHRAFIYEFETKLQKVSGKPITLPYVDWAGEGDNYQGAIDKSIAFNGYYYGQMKGQCLDGNIYSSFKVAPEFQKQVGTCMSINFDLKTKVGGWSTVDSMIFNDKDYNVFSDDLEVGTHYQVHTRIGGTMTTRLSPLLPAFWAHHSYIDMVLSTWQYVHDRWSNIPGDFANTQFQILSGQTYTHEKVFEMSGMCVQYERYTQSESSQDRDTMDPQLLKRMEDFVTFNDELQPTSTSTSESFSAATQVVSKNAYAKPNYTPSSNREITAYNRKVNDYYNQVKIILKNNGTNATDNAYSKCAEFYGNSSYIPVIDSASPAELSKLNINQAQYESSMKRQNARNIRMAKQANFPVYFNNKETKSYETVKKNLVAAYKDNAGKFALFKQQMTFPSTSNQEQSPLKPTATPGKVNAYTSSSSTIPMMLGIYLIDLF